MAAPTKKRHKATWKCHEPGRPKERLKIILEALEESPGTFEELLERTQLARTTLSAGLTELGDRIDRRVEPPKEVGKGKRHRVIIQLSEIELNPIAKTLRHLESLTAIPKLDVEKGRALFTEDVVDAIKEVEATRFSKFLPRLVPPKPSRAEFDEVMLITALACYYCERRWLPYPDKLERKRGKERIFPKATRGYTAFPIVRRRGLVRQFDELLEWIDPLLQASPLAYVLFQREVGDHNLRTGYRMGEPNISLLDQGGGKEGKKGG